MNQTGDVVQLLNTSGGVVANYVYDTWGALISASGLMASINPLRYKGYYYDEESGLYYLNSWYYDPLACRFINADGEISTGQGFIGFNMYAYCGNNPVNRADPAGRAHVNVGGGGVAAGAVYIGTMVVASLIPSYASADVAPAAFATEIYSSSLYIRHEYSTEIYAITFRGNTYFRYTAPAAGSPHSASGINMSRVSNIVAYAHTHPNSNSFSGIRDETGDVGYVNHFNVNAYVVGPNLSLQRYNVSDGSIDAIRTISPTALTSAQRTNLESAFRISWDNHIEATPPCGFGCGSMTWPTS